MAGMKIMLAGQPKDPHIEPMLEELAPGVIEPIRKQEFING